MMNPNPFDETTCFPENGVLDDYTTGSDEDYDAPILTTGLADNRIFEISRKLHVQFYLMPRAAAQGDIIFSAIHKIVMKNSNVFAEFL